MSRRGAVSLVLAAAGTGLFLALAARNVELSELGPVLTSVRWPWAAGMLLLSLFVDIGLRAWRWRILLSRAADAPVGRLFRLSAIGLAINNVLFARIGELARAGLAARELGIPLATALASVAVERALDVATLLALFVTAAWMLPQFVLAPVRHGAGMALLGVIAAIITLALAQRAVEPEGGIERRLRRWPRAHEVVAHLALGAAVLRRPRALLPVLALSLGLWSVDAGVYWMGARALGLQAHVDYARSLLVLSWAGAGCALPALPGSLGTFEALVKSILIDLGAPAHQALAYALFVHASTYVLVTGMGLFFLYHVGLSLRGIRETLGEKKR